MMCSLDYDGMYTHAEARGAKMQFSLQITNITLSSVRGGRKKEPSQRDVFHELDSSTPFPECQCCVLLSVLAVRKKEPFMLNRRRRANAINIEIRGSGFEFACRVLYGRLFFSLAPDWR